MADDRERASNFYGEIKSLRERCHTLAGDAAAFKLEFKLWQREVNDHMALAKRHMETYEPLVDSMRTADEIAHALEENTKAQKANARATSTVRLSRGQLAVAICVGAGAIADLIVRLAH